MPDYHYSDDQIAQVLKSVKTIAIVGASGNEAKPSFRVLRFLANQGYEIFPVNPFTNLTEINGIRVYPMLADIDAPIDMVDIFRPKSEFAAIADQAIAVGAKVLWGQLDIYDDVAAAKAEAAGMTVIMDRCPAIEIPRLSRSALA